MLGIVIEVYRSKPRLTLRGLRRDWRWRALSSNGETLANGGQGYNNNDDVISALKSLGIRAPVRFLEPAGQ